MNTTKGMDDPVVIVIERDIRDHLKEVARKSQRYTDILDELIILKEREINTSLGGQNPATSRQQLPTRGNRRIIVNG
jgi:hypothetical protein